MADGVDAPVDAMEAALSDAVVNRLTTEAQGPELFVTNDAVLSLGNGCDRKVARVRLHLFSHSENKCRSGSNPPP